MKTPFYLFLLCLGFIASSLFIACGDTNQTTEVVAEDTAAVDTLSINVIDRLKPELRLTQKASDSSKNWTLYTSLEKILLKTKDINLGDLKEEMANARALFDKKEQAEEDNISMPVAIKQPPAVNARVLVIETKIKILNDLLLKESIDINAIEVQLIELHNAFQDLRLQMNERYAKSIEQMLEELREEQEEQDARDINETTPTSRPSLSLSENY
ncbi:hypothetical protein EAX61_08715 [Dokdonia sinensis]|uniref:Uncharacterized protein n=1 Tax=Dokdonia sinensis TaxID=2479847 RepID=A0A3M0GC68_9FLAO|nr:hypothetical protein [Dokdonia sinensis]RMB59133.1 hypothetical protein EAX61_08715 [Dokdonia sinensis]